MITGLLLTLLVGCLWVLVGVFYKMMAKWDLSVFSLELAKGPVSILLFLLFYTKTGALAAGSVEYPALSYVLYMFFAGVVNAAGSLVLQRSMIYGKSSVTWAIGQSALIVPFLVITLVFSEPWNFRKILGTIAVLTGMFFLSSRNKSDPNPKGRYGIALALLAFVILGAAQTMFAGSSFFSYEDPANLRPLLVSLGALAATAVGKIILKDKGFHINRKALLLIVLSLLQGVAATCMQFAALDRLAEVQMNAIFFPVAIGVCIGGYALSSVLFFKEKLTAPLLAGLSVILLGITAFCFAG